MAIAVNRDEGQERPARHPPDARQRLFREHFHLHLERRAPHRRHEGLEDDQIADFDRMQKLQTVHGRSDEQAARVPVARNRAGDVDEVHHRAAENVPERVRIVRQDDLHHFRGAI